MRRTRRNVRKRYNKIEDEDDDEKYSYEDEDEDDEDEEDDRDSYEDDEEDSYYDDEDDDEKAGNKLEKIITIGGFAIAAIIICMLIYFIAQAAGIVGGKDRPRMLPVHPPQAAPPLLLPKAKTKK